MNYLLSCMDSHQLFDLITIMLGANDLKFRFSVSAYDIAESVSVLIRYVQQSAVGPDKKSPTILLTAPPPLVRLSDCEERFQGGIERSQLFGRYFRKKLWV